MSAATERTTEGKETPGVPEAAGLRQAAAWRLLGLLLERPRAGWVEEVQALAREAEDPRLREAAASARRATEGEYLAILGPGGPVSPREVAYRDGEDPARVLADVSACYGAFAYHPRAEDPVDHIAVEAGFAGYLIVKEIVARSAGHAEHADTAALARARFVQDHLAPFARQLAARLAGRGGHLEAASQAMSDRVAG